MSSDFLNLFDTLLRLPSVSSANPALDMGNRAVIELLAETFNALGFKLKDKGKRACVILSSRPDPSTLEHYSLQIGSALMNEMCLAMSAKFNPQELFEIL